MCCIMGKAILINDKRIMTMRVKESRWFEVRFCYNKMAEDGTEKKAKEKYLVESESFGEAEDRVIENMVPYVQSEYEVKEVKKSPYSEVLFCGDNNCDKFFMIKVDIITMDERTAKEKKATVAYLVESDCADTAIDRIHELYKDSVIEYAIKTVTDSGIVDSFEK